MKNIRKLVYTAMLVTLAISIDVLVSIIPGLNLSMPFGGRFFGISMIPLVFIGLNFGLKYGLMGCFIYAMYNFGSDYIIYLDTLRVTLESWTGERWSFFKIVLLFLLDYGIPFTAFGFSGLFFNIKGNTKKIILSFSFVSLVRLISSSLSGILLWSSSIRYAVSSVEEGLMEPNLATRIFEFVGNDVYFYSFIYNFSYLITTFVVSILLASLISKRLPKIVNVDQ